MFMKSGRKGMIDCFFGYIGVGKFRREGARLE